MLSGFDNGHDSKGPYAVACYAESSTRTCPWLIPRPCGTLSVVAASWGASMASLRSLRSERHLCAKGVPVSTDDRHSSTAAASVLRCGGALATQASRSRDGLHA